MALRLAPPCHMHLAPPRVIVICFVESLLVQAHKTGVIPLERSYTISSDTTVETFYLAQNQLVMSGEILHIIKLSSIPYPRNVGLYYLTSPFTCSRIWGLSCVAFFGSTIVQPFCWIYHRGLWVENFLNVGWNGPCFDTKIVGVLDEICEKVGQEW